MLRPRCRTLRALSCSDPQVAELRKHGAGKVFREVASGAKTDRAQLRRVLDQLEAGDVLTVTRLDRWPDPPATC